MAASPLERGATEDNQAPTAAAGGNELDELLGRKLQGLDLLAVFFYGIEVAQCPVVVALGVDVLGSKHPLGVWEGSTSDRTVCRALVAGLVERGLERDIRRLFVTDGGVAIRAAVRAVFGRGSLIQRCRMRKRREILSHLPRSAHSRTGRMLDEAWSETDVQHAKSRLRAVASDLQAADLGGTRSVLEDLDEGLTVTRLGLPRSLRATFSSTAEAEWAMSSASLDSRQWPAGTQAIEQAAALLRAEERSGPVRGHRDLHWLARALDPGREPLLTAEQPIPEGDRAVLAKVPAPDSLPFLTTAVDVAALVTTAALMVTMAFGVQGAVRELLALAFITLVPGWAVIGRLALEGGIRRIALAVPVSLATCTAAATTMLWLHAWRPIVLFGVLALGSAALINWTLTTPLRHAIAQSPRPARSLLRAALDLSSKGERRPRWRLFRWDWLDRRHRAPTLTSAPSAAALAPTAGPAPAAATVRSQGRSLEAWLGVLAILLFCLILEMSLVLFSTVNPLMGAVSLGVGAFAGVVLGASRRRVVIEGALLAGLLAGLVAIGWLLLEVDFLTIPQAAFRVGLQFWAPGMLGVAFGATIVPTARHFKRQFALDVGAGLPPTVRSPRATSRQGESATVSERSG